MAQIYSGLVGDVGGTNARFALVDGDGHLRHTKTYICAEYGALDEIITVYLNETAGKKRPAKAVIAVAGPVVDGEIEFTNLDWQVSETDLIAAFGFDAIKLVNDFAGQAMAAPVLAAADMRSIGPELRGASTCPIVVLGPGTGFGVAAVARSLHVDIAVATEAGHAGFSPHDEVEAELWRRLRERYGRVSVERVLSGQGVYDLYAALEDMAGRTPELPDERAVIAAGAAGDAACAAVLDRFCAILGGVAGDLALTYGARGGVYVGGGIAPRMVERLMSGGFRDRFEAKGRLSPYVRDIPTFLITHPFPALVGCARELSQLEGVRL
ncbi:glucokinase [Phenylobacterium sp.]|uniref:glucokinase n=1 Tax=Phenylobacterium sp. TaxID=1871053 RepID=UPI00272F3A1B|nr:glucokinase [Phenylobacterium sp.]MDP2213992.1 glucokinase [Phenylobacterium sp.]